MGMMEKRRTLVLATLASLRPESPAFAFVCTHVSLCCNTGQDPVVHVLESRKTSIQEIALTHIFS